MKIAVLWIHPYVFGPPKLDPSLFLRIWIRIWLQIRIRILPSTSKKSKKKIDLYYFMTAF
jgi:hypothetical protein